MVEKRLDKSP